MGELQSMLMLMLMLHVLMLMLMLTLTLMLCSSVLAGPAEQRPCQLWSLVLGSGLWARGLDLEEL